MRRRNSRSCSQNSHYHHYDNHFFLHFCCHIYGFACHGGEISPWSHHYLLNYWTRSDLYHQNVCLHLFAFYARDFSQVSVSPPKSLVHDYLALRRFLQKLNSHSLMHLSIACYQGDVCSSDLIFLHLLLLFRYHCCYLFFYAYDVYFSCGAMID